MPKPFSLKYLAEPEETQTRLGSLHSSHYLLCPKCGKELKGWTIKQFLNVRNAEKS